MSNVASVVNASLSAGFTPVVRVGGRTALERSEDPETNEWDDNWLDGWNEDALASVNDALTKMPNVRYWQIENEPQVEFFGDCQNCYAYNATNWTRFHELLKREAAAIHSDNSNNIVISPGLAGGEHLTNDGRLDAPVYFLETYFYNLELGDEDLPFDILAFHLWSFADEPQYYNRWRQSHRGIMHRIKEFRSLLDERDYDLSEIWITEASKSIVRSGGEFTNENNPTDQNNFVIDVIEEVKNSGEVMKVFWYGWKANYANIDSALIFNDTGPNLVYYTWKANCLYYNRYTESNPYRRKLGRFFIEHVQARTE